MRFMICLAALLMSSLPAYADSAPAGAWYEGGSLQKASVEDWQRATPANQIATAADFVASLSSIPDIGAIKDQDMLDAIWKQTESLVNCINQQARLPDTVTDRPVAEFVVLCTIVKKKPQTP